MPNDLFRVIGLLLAFQSEQNNNVMAMFFSSFHNKSDQSFIVKKLATNTGQIGIILFSQLFNILN